MSSLKKIQELEKYVEDTYRIDLKNLYTDLNDCYKEDGDKFSDKQKLLLLLNLNHYTIQKAANFLDFKNKESISQECSRYLFKHLRTLLRSDKIMWNNIFISIQEDGGYIDR